MDNPWIDIRNSAGHLLFRYNPFSNEIELRLKGITYELVKLDEIRAKFGLVEVAEQSFQVLVLHSKET